MTYDKTTALRLVAELREDDARMTPGSWTGDADAVCDRADVIFESLRDESDAPAIARLRNNAKPLADQLEAAVVEVERLVAAQPNWDLTEALAQRDALLHQVMEVRSNHAALTAALRAEFGTDSPAQIAAMSRMVIADRDRMQDALAAADPQAEAALAIDVLLEVDEGRPDPRVVKLAQQVLRLTARAQVAELEAAAMRPVVAAAEEYRDHGPCFPGIIEAVDAYRSGAEARDIEVARIAGNAPSKENRDG